MQWLAVVLLAMVCLYLLYMCNLLRITFGRDRTGPLTAERRDQKLESLLTTDNMDCESVMIWESQLPVLQLLQRAGKRGLSREKMSHLFREFSHEFPELTEGSQAENWLSALQQQEVITRRGRNFTITEKGLFILNLLEYQKIHPCEERLVHAAVHS